jgi:phage terminase small subunit
MAKRDTFTYEGEEHIEPTEKQKKFVQNLIEGDNQTKAYQKVLSAKNYNTARAAASQVLAKVNVRAYYEMKKAEYWKERHISTDEAIANLESIVKAKITDFLKLEGKAGAKYVVVKDFDEIPEALHCVIKEVKQTQDGIEVRFYDKLKAIEMFLRMQGAFEKDNEQKREKIVFTLPDNGRK